MQIVEVRNLISVFDLKKLEGLLRDFYEISHIRITVFDEGMNELVSYPAEVAPYCQVIRGTPAGLEACLDCDRQACRQAAAKHGTYVYRCHAGLTEAVRPLRVGGVLVGYLLFGHVFSYPSHEEGWKTIRGCCEALPINLEKLREAVLGAQPVGEDYIRSAARILHAVAACLVLEQMAVLKEDDPAVRLDAYVCAHYTEALTGEHLCEALGIGRTQLYKLSRQLYGCGVAEHIRSLRMVQAKKLLSQREELTLAQIAEKCGYGDYNYFISVFSRETGCSPGAYRKKYGNIERSPGE